MATPDKPADATAQQPWYAGGLRFTCTGCGDCCTGAPGYVWVNQQEIDALMAEHDLDAIVALTNGPAWPTNDDPNLGDLEGRFFEFFVGSSGAAAVSGYADITVPAAYVQGLPVNITFIGGRWDEPDLLGLAYDFEQATQVRVPPQFVPTIGDALFPGVPNSLARTQASQQVVQAKRDRLVRFR